MYQKGEEKMMERSRILAVDDNSISLATIEQELKRERPNLILMDIQMAQKSGIETLQEIRRMEKCKDIPVIMLTSRQDKASVVESSKLGVFDYVVKPFQGDDLRRRIENALRDHK